MANTNEGAGATTARTRNKVSKRGYINEDKSDAERIEDARGASYTLVDGDTDVRRFDYLFGESENADRMFAILGFHTKVGNVANTRLNPPNKEEAGTHDEAADDISEFLANVESGVWAERAAGGGAAQKINLDLLVDVLYEQSFAVHESTAGAKGVDPNAADLADRKAKSREKLENDKKWRAEKWNAAGIKEAYARAAGRKIASVEDALADL